MGPMAPTLADQAQAHLRELAGPDARLRPEQLEAIEVIAERHGRALVVQRTGFGKSAIYFIATRLLRDAGAGPTLVVSPLLALMRDQVAAAGRMGVRSATINSTNTDDWDQIEADVAAGEVDLLCISPERLNNATFVRRVLPRLASGLGLLVIDEAHCISDWGHDFRPDYRRIRDAIANLAPGTPILATTATANARVCEDVAEQLGAGVTTLRGTLDRESLHLGVANLPSLAHRYAWLAQRVPQVDGTGIVYCLTVAQTSEVAEFLRGRGIDAAAYSSDTSPDERARLEAAFKANELKVLVATSALGMGVDKPDVTFVFHLGAPPSPIAYYQQVGRAGRSVPRAEAWLLPDGADRAIWDWFASVGMPSETLVRRTLDALGEEPTTIVELERSVDLRRTRLETLLKILDVDETVRREGSGWVLTGTEWRYDHERVAKVEATRAAEAEAMVDYASGRTCLMQFLRESLDDVAVEPCGRCAVCLGIADPVTLDDEIVRAAVEHLRGVEIPLEPRKQWPRGLDAPRGNIANDARAEPGRALCRVGDAGWWPTVDAALRSGRIDDELVDGIARALKSWNWQERPRWVTWVPSTRHDALLGDLASQLARLGKLASGPVIERVRDGRPQSEMANAAHKLRNVWDAFEARSAALDDPAAFDGPGLVLDDLYDSGWTATVVAATLRGAGSGPVLPFALTRR
jgi:ATP-dependent DNA helicase RecQ